MIPQLGNIPLSQLRPEHLQKHYSKGIASGLSPQTVRYHHALLHIALKTAVKWDLVNHNVADAVNPPRLKRTVMQIWDEDEVKKFLSVARENQYYVLFYTALFTGMRRGELLALRWQDVEFRQAQICVSRSIHQLRNGAYVYTEPKSEKSRRTIALSPTLVLRLKEYKEEQESENILRGRILSKEDLVFNNKGKPLRPNTITYAWKRLAVRARVRVIRFRDARHTHASLMLKLGEHPKVVQERLGHPSIQMALDTYSHVAPGIQQAAAVHFDRLLQDDELKIFVANS